MNESTNKTVVKQVSLKFDYQSAKGPKRHQCFLHQNMKPSSVFYKPVPYRCTLLEKRQPPNQITNVNQFKNGNESKTVNNTNDNFLNISVFPKVYPTHRSLVSIRSEHHNRTVKKRVAWESSNEEYFDYEDTFLACLIALKESKNRPNFKQIDQRLRKFPAVSLTDHVQKKKYSLKFWFSKSQENRNSTFVTHGHGFIGERQEPHYVLPRCKEQKRNQRFDTNAKRTKLTIQDGKLCLDVYMPGHTRM